VITRDRFPAGPPPFCVLVHQSKVVNPKSSGFAYSYFNATTAFILDARQAG